MVTQVVVEDNGVVEVVPVAEGPEVVQVELAILGPQGPSGPATIPFSRSGEAVLLTGQQRLYMEYTGHVSFVRASVGTPPTGADLIADINKNGTSIYTTQANRPIIPAGQNTGLAGSADIDSFVQGDFFTIDVDQIGSTTPGTDLVITMTLERD